MSEVRLVVPDRAHLAAYVEALEGGWSPDNVRGRAAAEEQLAAIRRDEEAFLAAFDDPEGKGPPVRLPDGSIVRRLPGITRWIWSEGFAGSIGFRWERGTAALPDHVLGHIGFAVVPWKRRQGIGTCALALMLEEPRRRALASVEITTTPDNVASQRVIEANGGVLVERFTKAAAYGGGEALRYRIHLD